VRVGEGFLVGMVNLVVEGRRGVGGFVWCLCKGGVLGEEQWVFEGEIR